MTRHTERIDGDHRIPLVDEVTAMLRERIYAGRYPPGAWLRQEQLSAELGVSRTPLREALRALEQVGLVQVVPGQGARVVSGDLPTLLAAYELRAVVDGLAARLAATSGATKNRLRGLRAVIQQQRAAVEPWVAEAYTEANVAFHEDIVHMSGNEFVIAQTPILKMTAQVFAPVALVEPPSAQRAIREHVAIVDAIEAGDGTGAERLARAHIEATIAQLRNVAPAARDEGEAGAS